MNRPSAYPLTILFFGAFDSYQLVRYSVAHSVVMLLLTIFDVTLVYPRQMEWREQTFSAAAAILGSLGPFTVDHTCLGKRDSEKHCG